jgi:hypothetical protein
MIVRTSMRRLRGVDVPQDKGPLKGKPRKESTRKRKAITQVREHPQGRAQIRRLHPDRAARPALMGRAAHAVESKAVELFFFFQSGSLHGKRLRPITCNCKEGRRGILHLPRHRTYSGAYGGGRCAKPQQQA